MKIRIEDGLPLATFELVYFDKKIVLQDVLIDTGCSVSIFDTDLMAEIGVIIDFAKGISTTMYGVGGKGEVCSQQKVSDLYIDGQPLNDFNLQLGMVKDMYGFDGLIGIDFMLETGLLLDFHSLITTYYFE
jgi:hypothetical protein